MCLPACKFQSPLQGFRADAISVLTVCFVKSHTALLRWGLAISNDFQAKVMTNLNSFVNIPPMLLPYNTGAPWNAGNPFPNCDT